MSNITREQNKNLITTVAKLVNVLKKNEKVECIYLMPYKNETENIYDLVVVYSDYETVKAKNKKLMEYINTRINEKLNNKTIGGKLYITADGSRDYHIAAVESSEVAKVKDLLSSRVLYTKKGYGRKYHKIAHQFDRYKTLDRYTNYIRIGIPDKQKKQMKKIKGERVCIEI